MPGITGGWLGNSVVAAFPWNILKPAFIPSYAMNDTVTVAAALQIEMYSWDSLVIKAQLFPQPLEYSNFKIPFFLFLNQLFLWYCVHPMQLF